MPSLLDWADFAVQIAILPVSIPCDYIYRKQKSFRETRAVVRKARDAQEKEDARFYHAIDGCGGISHRDIVSQPAKPQPNCPLFQLPIEIRMMIYTLVVTDYEELNPSEEERWSTTQPFYRPGFTARRRQDTALLRTCRVVYHEAWHLPNLLKEQVWWIENFNYRDRLMEDTPPGFNILDQHRLLCQTIRRMKGLRGYRGDIQKDYYYLGESEETETTTEAHRRRSLEIADLRVFACPETLQRPFFHAVLSTRDFYPRRVTLTFRHVQWMGWKSDQPLVLPAAWIPAFSRMLSPSTRVVLIELETVARKKEQVDFIAAQISRRWFFKRPDGAVLYADATEQSNVVTKWTGRSVLGYIPERWVRDEVREGEIEYCVVRVPFKEKGRMRRGARVRTEALKHDHGTLTKEVRAPGEAMEMTHSEAAITMDWRAGDWPGWKRNTSPYPPTFRCPRRPAWRSYKHHHWDRW